MKIRYAIYSNGKLFSVFSSYRETCKTTDGLIEGGFRVRVEEITDLGNRVIFDAANGN